MVGGVLEGGCFFYALFIGLGLAPLSVGLRALCNHHVSLIKKVRKTLMESLTNEERTMIFYESPMRLVKTLELFATHFGADRKASVSRELTKIYEENITDTLSNLVKYFSEKQVKGEIVIVVEGKND